MEVVRGVSITRYCFEKNLPIEERLRLFQAVCAGVQHAHQKGIIHRDLKPNNLLVTEIDGLAVPKIIDFGIAKATTMDRLTDFAFVTRVGQLMGTPVYMSPEQANANPDIDTRSDVYSLGALLYELLAGRPPFDVSTLHAAGFEEMRRIIREVDPKPPSSRIDETEDTATDLRHSKDLDLITLRALEKDRNRRYESATALGADIERFLTHQPIHARASSTLYRLARWLRRNWESALATTFVLLATFIAAGVGIAERLNAEKQANEANTMMKMLMVTTLWETAKIDYVALTKMRDVIALTAARVDSTEGLDEERMRICTGLGKAYYGLEDWDKFTRYTGIAHDIAIRTGASFRSTRELHELCVTGLLYAGRSEEAVTLAEELVPLFDKNLTPDDPSLIYIRKVHAEALADNERYEESLAAFDALFELINNWPNVPRPMDVVDARLYYPEILRDSGDARAALKAARENVELAKHGLGEVDVLYADTLVMCAHECIESGALDEAHGHLRFAWQLYLDTYGPGHIRTAEYKDELLAVKEDLGLDNEILEVWNDTIDLFKDESGPTAPETLEEIDRFLAVLLADGLTSEAIELAEATLQDLEESAETPRGLATDWLPKMRARLKEAQAVDKGAN
jgi:tetratricopeptide (TPR) repeat protein